MANSACYEDAVAFSTARSSRPRATQPLPASVGDNRGDAAAALVPPLVYFATHGSSDYVDAAIRLLDEVRRVAAVEAAAGRRIPPNTCHQLVDTSLRIADRAAVRHDESSEQQHSTEYTYWAMGASTSEAIAAGVRGPLLGFLAHPPLAHAVIETIYSIGQGYDDFGPRPL